MRRIGNKANSVYGTNFLSVPNGFVLWGDFVQQRDRATGKEALTETAELSERAPVRSAGLLRESSTGSLHGPVLQTSQDRCPWPLPPSPLASTRPSGVQTRMAPLELERCVCSEMISGCNWWELRCLTHPVAGSKSPVFLISLFIDFTFTFFCFSEKALW